MMCAGGYAVKKAGGYLEEARLGTTSLTGKSDLEEH